MQSKQPLNRRRFLIMGTAGMGTTFIGSRHSNQVTASAGMSGEASEVTPTEDLMFEHGVIERMLLIYEEAAGRIERKQDVPISAIAATAELARRFNEDYHAKLEEREVFPRFEKVGQYMELVNTLKLQHEAGRRVTDLIVELTGGARVNKLERLAGAMRSYSRMYAPHAARENSVLFKAFQSMLPADEYRELGEQFEEKEHDLFGEDGFHRIVAQVADIEKQLGIYNLAQFTAEMEGSR